MQFLSILLLLLIYPQIGSDGKDSSETWIWGFGVYKHLDYCY